MLVDLARNDVNRVCKPETVHVDHLLKLEKFSHVIHITSQVSGLLRADKTRFDAFRSIFPAGTVSGAPKIKAIELVYECARVRYFILGQQAKGGQPSSLNLLSKYKTSCFKHQLSSSSCPAASTCTATATDCVDIGSDLRLSGTWTFRRYAKL